MHLASVSLLPPSVLMIKQQVRLRLERVRSEPDDVERYIGLASTTATKRSSVASCATTSRSS